MNTLIESRREAISDLCRKHGVTELYLFGSALRDDFGANSDIDFLVDFDYGKSANAFHQYFDFKSGLEELLEHPIDLICYRSIRNPYFKQEVEETKQAIYAA